MIHNTRLRLGITGHRWTKVAPAHADVIADRLRTVFDQVAGPDIPVTLVCGMAEGADTIAAQIMPTAWQLEAALALPSEQWIAHLRANPDGQPDDAAQAARLIQSASVVTPDHGRSTPDYAWVATHIVTTCDRLIAVWDGEPGSPGGTAQVVAMAQARGLDVTILSPGL